MKLSEFVASFEFKDTIAGAWHGHGRGFPHCYCPFNQILGANDDLCYTSAIDMAYHDAIFPIEVEVFRTAIAIHHQRTVTIGKIVGRFDNEVGAAVEAGSIEPLRENKDDHFQRGLYIIKGEDAKELFLKAVTAYEKEGRVLPIKENLLCNKGQFHPQPI